MSCHISALCITLPSPISGLERPLWEEDFMKVGTPILPLQSTDNTSKSPLGDNLGESAPSTSRPSLSRRKRSSLFSTLQVDVGDATHVGTILWPGGLFSGLGGVLGESDHGSEGRSAWYLRSTLQMEPRLNGCSPQKGVTIQVIASELN